MHLPHILHSIHLHGYCLSQHDDGRLHRTAVPQHYDLPGYVSLAAVPAAAVPAAVTPTDSPFRFAFFPTLPQKAEAGGGGFMHVCREGSNRADPSRHFFVRTKGTKGMPVEDAKKTESAPTLIAASEFPTGLGRWGSSVLWPDTERHSNRRCRSSRRSCAAPS
jgi:hypothetical protein